MYFFNSKRLQKEFKKISIQAEIIIKTYKRKLSLRSSVPSACVAGIRDVVGGRLVMPNRLFRDPNLRTGAPKRPLPKKGFL